LHFLDFVLAIINLNASSTVCDSPYNPTDYIIIVK
jgi:hypothetical protein